MISNSCIFGSNVSTPVFSDQFSNTTGYNNHGLGLHVRNFCSGMIFRETPGFACYQPGGGVDNCAGSCESFDKSGSCTLHGLTRVPTTTPSQAPQQTYAPSTMMPSVVNTNSPSSKGPIKPTSDAARRSWSVLAVAWVLVLYC